MDSNKHLKGIDMVISFGTSGRVEAMHNDAFNLAFLGKREITRASEILFNDVTNSWDVFMDDGTGKFCVTSDALSGFNGYEEARKFEVEWLNACRLRGIDPVGDDLYSTADAVRLRQALQVPAA
jgi:hypothetical protein